MWILNKKAARTQWLANTQGLYDEGFRSLTLATGDIEVAKDTEGHNYCLD